jgi:hypothetical protein
MRASIFTLAAAGALAVAIPASALTVQPVSATPASSTVRALASDPTARVLGFGESFRESVADDTSGASGLPVYFEPTQAAAQADEARYAADPVGFMARVDNGAAATNAAAQPGARTAPKAPLTGR